MNNETLISNDKLILQLFEVFTCGFKSLLNSARDDELETLVKICPSLFRKWLFSALIEDTPLTPANIFLNLSGRAESFSVKTSLDKSGFVCTLCTAEDTLENSVFLSDLKALCLRCTPVGEYDFFSSETAYDFCGKFPELKLQDGYYVSYLAIIAQRLGLIAKMPAINTVKYQTGQYCTEFFSMSAKKQHDIILKEAISIFIEKTALQMQAPLTAADIPHIISILTESCITDSIFEYIYSSMGFDFEKIADIGQNPVLSEEDEALVSSVLYGPAFTCLFLTLLLCRGF